ncbi:MAG: hypothetical protein FJW31_06265 [Acidobacteria bacterium]|nr:hypothetical protein [Acidobacteriota bacterium]
MTRATIVAPASLTPREEKAVAMLAEEVEKRSWLRWPVAAQTPASGGASIVISRNGRGADEGYTIDVQGTTVRIDGNDGRGILFGIGHLLRTLHLERGRASLPDSFTGVVTSPQVALRGHQLGYRPKTNSYDAWDLRQWEQYIRELAVFGTNAIELIPPRSDDDDDSPHFPASKIDTMIGMSRIADEYGLDLWIWYPALDADYSKPETVEFALKEWAEVFAKLPRIDAVFVPGGDPGHTPPQYLMPLLEKQAASLRRHHSKAQMWVAPQGFSTEWLTEFYSILRQGPTWLNGVVFGPQIRVSLAELRAAVPAKYPIRLYPDITHSLRSQYSVRDWDPAYQATLNREPINPRPLDQAAIFRQSIGASIGFITYSEGCNDDVNKVVWSALGWNQKADVTGVLRDYGRFFAGHQWADGFAQGLLALERNWRGPLIANAGVEQTLAQFRQLDRDTPPHVHASWRFQQAQYRAHYDAYTRSRLRYEEVLEEQAMNELALAGTIGASAAMDRAEAVLQRAVTARVNAGWRTRVFELAEALFQSIRMQLSVPFYRAIAVGRGANLDLLDTPLNNRNFLIAEFARIRALGDEASRVAALAAIAAWSNPGPGGFYDDLGNPAAQPHLVSGLDYATDPYHLQSPLAALHPRDPAWRLSWQTVAESRNDQPLRMRYRDLDPAAQYRVRVVYGGEDVPHDFRLTAGGQHEVHGWMKKPKPVRPVEFDIPRAATADGDLELEFSRQPGIGGAGRAVQVAEVWLLR